jgi:hypothetical protein
MQLSSELDFLYILPQTAPESKVLYIGGRKALKGALARQPLVSKQRAGATHTIIQNKCSLLRKWKLGRTLSRGSRLQDLSAAVVSKP